MFKKRGQRVVYHRDRLATLYLTGKFEWPHSSTVSVMVQKINPSMDFMKRRTSVLEKGHFC